MVTGLLLLAALQQQPINTACPVKPNQSVKDIHRTVYEGQLIGFC